MPKILGFLISFLIFRAMEPHIQVFIGPMFGGKTTELLKMATSYIEQGYRVTVVKHDRDTRWNDPGKSQ